VPLSAKRLSGLLKHFLSGNRKTGKIRDHFYFAAGSAFYSNNVVNEFFYGG
jgi:hypothetical protein